MDRRLSSIKQFFRTRATDVLIGVGVVIVGVIIVTGIVFAVRSKMPQIVYQPVKACDLLKPNEAQDLLGNKVISVDSKDPEISGDTATSKCSYTDSNENTDALIVAAVAVRTGINDKGVALNKSDFEKAKKANDTEEVKDLGSAAFFNKTNGKLNVIRGHEWIIMNFGVGSSPDLNELEHAIVLAHKVLDK